MLVSVIIPCKNEPYLSRLISEIYYSLAYSHEILVQTEPGLSSAVLCGVRKSKGNIIVVLDADGSHNPRSLNKIVDLVRAYPIVVGSRYVNGGTSNDSIARQFLSRLFCKVARAGLKLEIEDPMSGFVAVERQVFDAIKLRSSGYKFALELIVKSNGRFKIFEQPIVFERRKIGASKTGVKEGIETILFVLMLCLRKISHKN